MSTEEFIIGLFVRVDEAMQEVPVHPLGLLYPSEIVTLGLLYALKGGGQRAFYRWLTRDYRALFPSLPERTRLFRLVLAHQVWTERFLAAPTVLGVADTDGIELVHPWREHRNPFPLGEKGLSNHRWIVGATRAVVLHTWGLVCGWDADAANANVHDSAFHGLIRLFDGRMIVLTDRNFVATIGNPPNMKPVKKGTWNDRMLIETFYSLSRSAKRGPLASVKREPHQRSQGGDGTRGKRGGSQTRILHLPRDGRRGGAPVAHVEPAGSTPPAFALGTGSGRPSRAPSRAGPLPASGDRRLEVWAGC